MTVSLAPTRDSWLVSIGDIVGSIVFARSAVPFCIHALPYRIPPTLQCELFILKCNSIRSGTSLHYRPGVVASDDGSRACAAAIARFDSLARPGGIYSDREVGALASMVV